MEELHFNADITGERIDKFLDGRIESLSRSYIQKLIKEKKILVNQLPVKANYKLTTGDTIILQIPDPEPLDIQPENIPLDILYEETERLFKRVKASREICELRNMINVGYLITRQAMERKESRGLHYTIDYPHPSKDNVEK
mgnify:CR=1 FL=1